MKKGEGEGIRDREGRREGGEKGRERKEERELIGITKFFSTQKAKNHSQTFKIAIEILKDQIL